MTIVSAWNASKLRTATCCHLCGSETVELLSARDYRRPSDRTEYSLCWCHECAMGRIAGNFSRQDVSRFYEIAYYTHESAAAPHRLKTSALDRLIVHLAWRVDQSVPLGAEDLGPSDHRTLCDIGCGAGNNLKRFGGAGFTVMGTEPDAIARARASRFGPVFDGIAEALPPEILSRRFDVVLLSHVLEHCFDLRAAVANIRSIIAPNGMLAVEVPNSAALGFAVYGAEWPWTDIPRHLNFFTEKSLRRILELAGFSIQKVHYTGYTRQFLPDWKTTQDSVHREMGRDTSRDRIAMYWWFLRTALAAADRKYDSVRIVATPRD